MRIHDKHYVQVCADREASGVAAARDEQKRIQGELENSAKKRLAASEAIVCATLPSSASLLLAVKLSSCSITKAFLESSRPS